MNKYTKITCTCKHPDIDEPLETSIMVPSCDVQPRFLLNAVDSIRAALGIEIDALISEYIEYLCRLGFSVIEHDVDIPVDEPASHEESKETKLLN